MTTSVRGLNSRKNLAGESKVWRLTHPRAAALPLGNLRLSAQTVTVQGKEGSEKYMLVSGVVGRLRAG